MQVRYIRSLVLVVLCGVFITPGFLYALGVGAAALAGVENARKPVSFNVKNLMSLKVQDYAEGYFQKRSGVFDVLVKTDNQLNYVLFDSVSSNPRSTVVLGENGHLIEHLYIRNANRLGSPQPKQLRRVAGKLRRLQDNLTKRGMEFVLVISPNKPSFYPEIIPSRYRIAGARKRFDARRFMTKELSRQGVRYIDGFELLKQKEREFKVPMFSPIGTHWNEVGGCLVASEILRQTNNREGGDRSQFDCVVEGFHDKPAYDDSDLLRLANLWIDAPFEKLAPRVASKPLLKPTAEAPRLLIVGSSFCWELMRQLEHSGVTASQEFLYYFHRRTRKATDRGVNFDHSRYNVDKELKNRDIVVIEINQAVLTRAGFGFPEVVLGEPFPLYKK